MIPSQVRPDYKTIINVDKLKCMKQTLEDREEFCCNLRYVSKDEFIAKLELLIKIVKGDV